MVIPKERQIIIRIPLPSFVMVFKKAIGTPRGHIWSNGTRRGSEGAA